MPLLFLGVDMEFIKKFENNLNKKGVETGEAKPPRYWYSTGNFVLNRIISGSFYNGVPQGRLMSLAGPSGAGKSFLACNLMREAQQAGAFNVIIDTENAIDTNFLSGIGVDLTNNVIYTEANTIPDCKRIVSTLIQDYKTEYGDDPEAPRVHVTIDSLDMLMTETEEAHFEKGVTKGDQGQRSKQLKAMLREYVQNIKHLNMSIIATSQVYRNQDILNGEGTWIVGDAVRYAPSLVVLLTKLKLRENSKVIGIRMKCEGYKSRFTRPMQSVVIEVPYEKGIDPYNGLLSVAVELGVVESRGARYMLSQEVLEQRDVEIRPPYDKTWFSKDFNGISPFVLEQCETKQTQFLCSSISEDDLDLTPQQNAKKKRLEKFQNK